MPLNTFSLAIERIEEIRGWPVIVATFENTSEERRLTSAKVLLGYRIESPNLTQTQATAWRSFYDGQFGPLTAFNFTDPISGSSYVCRFASEIKITFEKGIRKVSCEFKVVNEVET